MTTKHSRFAILSLAAAIFIAAGIYFVVSKDKADGIFALLIAAVVCRVLVINLAGRMSADS